LLKGSLIQIFFAGNLKLINLPFDIGPFLYVEPFPAKIFIIKRVILIVVINMFRRGCIPVGLIALVFAWMAASGSLPVHDVSNQSIRGTSQDYRAASGTNTFMDAGCSADSHGLNCSRLGFDQQFGCVRISNTSTALGNLSPKIPMVECLFRNRNRDAKGGIVRVGCRFPVFRSYIITQGSEFGSIYTKEEFQSMFAPVETQEEALSFAVALTDSFPKYDTSAPLGYFPVASPIKPTYVEETDGKFKVNLFHRDSCGCGTHPYYAINYIVTRAGDVTELSRQKVYDSKRKICVD
jgi:hypothetical protein